MGSERYLSYDDLNVGDVIEVQIDAPMFPQIDGEWERREVVFLAGPIFRFRDPAEDRTYDIDSRKDTGRLMRRPLDRSSDTAPDPAADRAGRQWEIHRHENGATTFEPDDFPFGRTAVMPVEEHESSLARELHVCESCGHRQAEPNWCQRCGHRMKLADWAPPFLRRIDEEKQALADEADKERERAEKAARENTELRKALGEIHEPTSGTEAFRLQRIAQGALDRKEPRGST